MGEGEIEEEGAEKKKNEKKMPQCGRSKFEYLL
jgi:hypothetical protein